MESQQTFVTLPQELVDQIDGLVGADGREAFVARSAEAEVRRLMGSAEEAADRRRRLKEFFANDEPAWKDEDHPDIVAQGTAAWVRNRRQADEAHRLALLAEHEEKYKEAV